MRTRHVPGPLLPTRDDAAGAVTLLSDLMPVACSILGIDKNTELKLESLIRSDAAYLRLVLGAPIKDRPATTLQLLAKDAHLSRTGIYRALVPLAQAAEQCVVALVMLLAARGDYCDTTVWRICELDSPVGRSASGPGIVGGRQRLYGISLAGGDVEVPTILRAPRLDMSESEFVGQLDEMLGELTHVAERLRDFTLGGDPRLLGRVGLTQADLASYDPMTPLLGSELHVGPMTPAGWEVPLHVGSQGAVDVARRHGFEHVVLECSADPCHEGSEWMQIRPLVLRHIAGLAPTVGLDVAIRPSHVTYLMRNDGEGRAALHRRQHVPERWGDAVGSVVAGSLTYVLAGFALNQMSALGRAVSFAEFLATSAHGQSCRERFGAQLTPSLVKAQQPESRTLVRALRMLFNAALVAVGRERQARGMG